MKSAALSSTGQTFYQFLNLKEQASLLEIGRAYRDLAKFLHPDKNKAPDAEERFHELQQIYETLKDPDRREVYDCILRAYEQNRKRYASQREERQHFMDDLATRTSQFEEQAAQRAKATPEEKEKRESVLSRLIRETKEVEYEEEQKRKEQDFRSYFSEARVLEVRWKEGKSSLFSQDLLRQIFSSYGLLLSVDYQKHQALLTFESGRGAQTALLKAKEELVHTGLRVSIHKGEPKARRELQSEQSFISALKLEMALHKDFERHTGTWEEYMELEERILKKLQEN